MPETTPNIADEKSVQSAKRKATRTVVRQAEALRVVMSTYEGRLWLQQHIAACRVMQAAFQPNSSLQYFEAGERSVGVRLIAECEEASPSLFRQLEDERRERFIRETHEAT